MTGAPSSVYPQIAATYTAISQELAGKPHEYQRLARAAAVAEAEYKAARARRRLSARATGEARSAAAAEDIADADEDVASMYLTRLTTEAEAEACKMAMYALRARLSFGQTLIGVEKSADQQHAMTSPTWRPNGSR